MKKRVGSFTHNVNAPNSYKDLANSDEKVARLLFEHCEYRQSCYYILQSMEKLIRSKIFTLVDAKNEYFRNRNRSHSVEDAISFLVDVISPNDVVKDQVNEQLRMHVLGDTKYNHLHNNLRYPNYFQKYNSYSQFQVNKSDTEVLFQRLESLKIFIRDINAIA